MCGIYGGLDFSGQPIAPEILARMSRAVALRGPDGNGSFQCPGIALGHHRLAVIDLTASAHQPMTNLPGSHTIVFNGAIYNYQALRAELIGKGFRFQSHSDTEVIVNAYAHWGAACVERLHGMFALAIWDHRSGELFLARDRLGIKPLYYVHTDRFFFFASNIQALLQTGVADTGLDSVALHHAFTLHGVVPAPMTIFQGIRKCRPAHYLTASTDGRVHSRRYWELVARRPEYPRSTDEWRQSIHQALLQAVRERMTATDVRVGVLLSGGLDSSLLIGLLAEAGIDKLKTFSIGFEDLPEEPGNEFHYSDLVARHFATDHQRLLVSNDEVLQRLPEVVANMSEPMFGQDAVAFYLLAERVSQDVKVVQSGQGADEVFAGYSWYLRMLATPGSALQRFVPWYFDRDHDEYLDMVDQRHHVPDVTSALVHDALAGSQADTFIDTVLHFDVTTLVVEDPLRRVDNMTMAWGVEARVPFLDQTVVELAAQCPPELKLMQQGKGILKQIARGMLPDEVIDRPKAYFPVPALKYVRGPFYRFMADVLNSRHCRERGLFSRAYIEDLLREPDAHFTRLNGSKLWHSALFEYWLQTQLDSATT